MKEATSPSGEQVELAHGDQRAVVVGVGGGLRGYWLGDAPVLEASARIGRRPGSAAVCSVTGSAMRLT